MRDLYEAAGVLSDATYDEIARAIATRSGDLIERARYILLDPHRREVYDDAYHSMLVVASIRRTLGISETRYWSDIEVREWQGKGTFWYPIEVQSRRSASGVPVFLQSMYLRMSPGSRIALFITALVLVVLLFRWLGD